MPQSRPKIVVNKSTPRAVEVFSTVGDVHALDSSEFTPQAVRSADILIVRSETRVDRQLLEGSSVQFVGTVTIGTDHIDAAYLQSKNIRLASAPGSNARSVMEYVCAGLLSVWNGDVAGKTLGIVGVGHVGTLVARMAKALGMRVLLNDPPLSRATKDTKFVSLDELMSADAITVHVPLTTSGQDATYHLFDESRIKKMKRGSVLINTARGGVVETHALLDALTSRHLAGAILDVWENEPGINGDLLQRVTIGTPHIAGYSLDGRLRAVAMVYEEVCKFLRVSPSHPVSEQEIVQDIIVPSNLSGMDVVRFVILSAYDILADDSILRRVGDRPLSERGIYFTRLRSNYRTRHEFTHWNVRVSRAQEEASGILRELGFRVSVIS